MEQALEYFFSLLSIHYTRHSFPHSTLYFCQMEDGQTFDVKFEGNGMLRMWRFLDAVLSSPQAGSCLSLCQPNTSIRSGFSVTEEGDLCLFCEQQLLEEAGDALTLMAKQLLSFLTLMNKNMDTPFPCNY